MSIFLIGALVINLTIIILELWVFKGLKNKVDIIKYYTYLQNALALVVSILFSVFVILYLMGAVAVPEWIRGLRYTVTTGLCFTTAIYYIVLAPADSRRSLLSEDDFKKGCNYKKADLVLHLLCPLLSLLSFVFLEREIPLLSPEWTGLVAIPSVLYWCVYGVLTLAHLWEKPYNFTAEEKPKSKIRDVFVFAFIPVAFIGLSAIIWNLR